MASKAPSPQSDPNYWSPEKCRERFGSFLAADPESFQIRIPDWHTELLKERMARYCEVGMQGIPFEEYEKKVIEELRILKRLMKS